MKKPPLIQWYEKHGRHDLPWRNTTNPYHIYLSEIMLQQTQVKTVLERFYFQFLDRFPTLESLAKASEDEVLKAWEGLGYYTRARNLHKTARLTLGILPKSVEELVKLSGIGTSTAHAIACFAFGVSVPILDGNVKRILYRYNALKSANEKELWKRAYVLFAGNEDFAYEYNQALMDIGSYICTRTQPKCQECPLNQTCQGQTTPQEFPQKKPKKAKEQRTRFLIIYRHQNRLALFKNETNLLKGLYGFLQTEVLPKEDSLEFLGKVQHEYSHISLKAKVYVCEVDLTQFQEWFDYDTICQMALSKVDHKALYLLKK
ncbi:MAG: A/G-specific adenine glycosylase [Arcobacteraceae bacterium]